MSAPKRRDAAGRYAVEQRCDGCSKAITERTDGHVTDTDVCGASDGPGFYLCGRARCEQERDRLDVDARRALFSSGRARNAAR
jgi:hypothetical protein